jgi:AcrR family transcriptional regulator
MTPENRDAKGIVQNAVDAAVQKVQGRRELLREQIDNKIMQATLSIVISAGIGAVTIEEVSRRSGVAKTTIYRRYKNADDLLQRAKLEIAGLPDFNDLETSRNGLLTMLQRIQNCFDSELGLKAVGVVLSSDNDSLRSLADQVIQPAEQRFSSFINRGMANGIFHTGLNLHFLFSTVLGSMLTYEALYGSSETTWAEHMAELLWQGMAA